MRVVVAAVVFVHAAVLVALALAMAVGGLTPPIATAALITGILAGGIAMRHVAPPPGERWGPWDIAMATVFGLASLRAFLWLVYVRDGDLMILSPNNLGDISLHLNLIRCLSQGVTFWPESPILAGTPLVYPLGIDLFNALLECLRIPTIRGLVWVGLAGAALTLVALRRWGGAFALAAFLFTGGLAGFQLLGGAKLADFQAAHVWKNVFLSMFVTQRGLLIALPAGLLLLSHWRDRFFGNQRLWMPLWVQVLLYAGMPLFSLHSFLVLSVVLAVLFVARPGFRRELLTLGAASLIPASVLVFLVTGGFSAAAGIHWAPGWMLDEGGWRGLALGFGLTVPLLGVLGAILIVKADAVDRALAGTALGIALVCIPAAFAAWPWDNMKLLLWSWIICVPSLWRCVISPLAAPARWAVCFVLFFSGAVSLVGGLDGRHGYFLARRADVDAWQAALATVPIDERIACVPDYNHPVILLGRKVACGYEGHLWSHGLRYREKLDALNQGLNGSLPWELASKTLSVQWLALRPGEGRDATTGPFGDLYDLREIKPDPEFPTAPLPPPRPVDWPW